MNQKEFQERLTDSFRILVIQTSEVLKLRYQLNNIHEKIDDALSHCKKIAELLCITDLETVSETADKFAKILPLDEILAKMIKACMNGYVLLAENYPIGEPMCIDYLRRAHAWLSVLSRYIQPRADGLV